MGQIADSIKRGRPRKHAPKPKRETRGRPSKAGAPSPMRSVRISDPDWDKLKRMAAREQTTATGWIEQRIRSATER